MHRARITAALLCVALLALASCAHHRLVVPEPVPGSPGYHATTSHAFFWGIMDRQIPATECVENSLEEVRVTTSLPHALATVLTLGAWMPLRLEYKCGKRPVTEGVLGESGGEE
jgi:hypothetical protein